MRMRHTCRLGNPCAILVIEDNPDVVKLLQIAVDEFEPGCFILEAASTAKEAISKLNAIIYDAIILDLSLPDSHGIATLKALRHTVYNLGPVIILTGTHDIETELQAFEEGASEYITKPFNGQEVFKRIRHSILRRRRINADKKEQLEALEIIKSVEKQIHGEPKALLREAAEDILRVATGMSRYN